MNYNVIDKQSAIEAMFSILKTYDIKKKDIIQLYNNNSGDINKTFIASISYDSLIKEKYQNLNSVIEKMPDVVKNQSYYNQYMNWNASPIYIYENYIHSQSNTISNNILTSSNHTVRIILRTNVTVDDTINISNKEISKSVTNSLLMHQYSYKNEAKEHIYLTANMNFYPVLYYSNKFN